MSTGDARSLTCAAPTARDDVESPDALMSLWTVDERLLAMCDATCYADSTSSPDACQCLCGGRNHGAGREEALAQTRVHGDAWVRAYVRAHAITDFYAMTVSEPEELAPGTAEDDST